AAAGRATRRRFGSAPGTYGSGAEALLQSGAWRDRAALGAAYLATADHAFDEGGDDGAGRHDPDGFSAQVARADLLVHIGDDAGRDLLEGSADAAFIGGFAAAAARLGKAADLVTLDTRDPHRPRARALIDDLRRVVTGRAVNLRYIAGQMRHGPRGAADFAETVDRLVAFAETTESVPSALIDMVHDAYVGDARVRDFIRAENPAAGQAIAHRLSAARRRGLWHPRRNQVDDELAALAAPLAGDAP
ncbi:MAG: cobaltochelatase subunit CobN, partial [Pseudomonadota bacterium]|nr:cobaltochelatase subunit CobN [Pseudomonadota bacterium]